MPSTTKTRPTEPRQLVGEQLARTRWSADQLAVHQRTRLDALLRHAAAVSLFYRRRLGADPTGAPLGELPTLSKATLMASFDEIITDPRLRRAWSRSSTSTTVRCRPGCPVTASCSPT